MSSDEYFSTLRMLMIGKSGNSVQVSGADIFKWLYDRHGLPPQEVLSVIGDFMAKGWVYSPKPGHFKLQSSMLVEGSA